MYVILHIEFSSEMFCTHRQYDIRIGLYNYEYVTEGEPLHAVVREMVGTLSFPARHLVQFKPKMARWNIHVLRCKRKTTFQLDDRFAATVNCMSEHTFDVEKGQVIELDLKMEQHTEVEVSIVRLRLTMHDIINVLLTAAAQLGLGMCVWSRCRLLLKPGAVLAH